MKERSNTKVENKSRKDAPVLSSDPVAHTIMSELYTSLQEANHLTDNERIFLSKIEQKISETDDQESSILKGLIDQVHSLINEKKDWKTEHQELFSSLENIVSLGAKETVFKGYFDQLQEAINSVMRLDFSAQIAFTGFAQNQKNLLNYFSVYIEMITEKLETSVVSTKSTNAIISEIFSNELIIITNSKGQIRFINDTAITFLNRELYDLMESNISEIIQDYTDIKQHASQIGCWSKKMLISIKNEKETPFYLSILKPLEHPEEVTEIVHILKKQNNDEQPKITQVSDSISEDLEPIDFNKEIRAIIKHFKNANDQDIKFSCNIDYDILFFSSREMIQAILNNIISTRIKTFQNEPAPRIDITVKRRGNRGILITTLDNGEIIAKKDQKKIFDERYEVKSNSDSTKLGIYTLYNIVDDLNGIINLESNEKMGTIIFIDLPHLT